MADERPPANDEARPWTRIDDYIVLLARSRGARRSKMARIRTQPEEPRFLLSTLPFVLLMAALLVMAVAIFLIAWPGSRARPETEPKAEQREQGVAPSGWLKDAEREFH